MSWSLLVGLVLALGLALCAAIARQVELARMREKVGERQRATRHAGDVAQLAEPVIDLSRCLGCGACVRACPEDGVLALVHGQAQVVNGAHCQGHATCESECPVDAIQVTLANIAERRDVPVLEAELEATGTPGLFLAGEVTAHALIRTAVEQGTLVANAVARRATEQAEDVRTDDALDLCIVGAGPAGFACALEAKRLGLSFVVLDQAHEVGGTVAKYPRQKLVMTRPVDLPLFGRLDRTSYTKEELVELWQRIAREQELQIEGGTVFEGVDRDERDRFVVRTQRGEVVARHVCLALGRRGTPNKLDVPGEELPKVAYGLLDARSYAGRRVLVVGGGDSAIEGALALAEQEGTEVTLSYRRSSLFRLKARNEQRIDAAIAEGRVRPLFTSRVVEVRDGEVEFEIAAEPASLVDSARGAASHSPAHGALATSIEIAAPAMRRLVLPNDDVFVLAGGVAPIALLEKAGVSFDPALRPPPPKIEERGTGLVPALATALFLSLAALAFALWNYDYYSLPAEVRPSDPAHDMLRPGHGMGLMFGLAAAGLIAVNLLYLVRRATWQGFTFGSLATWMTSHVATGVLAVLCALLHGAMAPRDTVGGHAFVALAVLLVTGAIGRYFYAWVPRAANGRERSLEEVRRELDELGAGLDAHRRAFVARTRADVASLVEARQWKTGFAGRLTGLVLGQRDLRRLLARLGDEGTREGLSADDVHALVHLARRAHSSAVMAAHYEDLRALLASWRYAHRWVAALMVLLVVLHVAYALSYGSLLGGNS